MDVEDYEPRDSISPSRGIINAVFLAFMIYLFIFFMFKLF